MKVRTARHFLLLFCVYVGVESCVNTKVEMVEELRENMVQNLLFVTSFLKLVSIDKITVPDLVEVTSSNVILDCQFTVVDDNFTLQWIFNNGITPVYEWSPNSEPKIAGVLEGRLDLTYRVSRNLYEGRRALRITNLTTDLSGQYTCIVSNRGAEARKTKEMLIYSVERDFQLKTDWHLNSSVIDISCIARGLYPRPDLTIEYNNGLVSGQLQRVWRNDDGLFDLIGFAQAETKSESDKAVIACRLHLPQADYTAIKKKILYNGENRYRSKSWTLALMFVLYRFIT